MRIFEYLTFKSGDPQGVCDRANRDAEVHILSAIGLSNEDHAQLAKPDNDPDKKYIMKVKGYRFVLNFDYSIASGGCRSNTTRAYASCA